MLFAIIGLVLPVSAQAQIDLPAARQYATQLESNFWERAWIRHLEKRADSDSTIRWEYGDRQKLSEITNDYQRAIGEASGFWTNLQVQDYLQRQLLTVQPNSMMLGRPGALRLRVLSTTTPNALALSDGTIILSTGFLTALETRVQLQALLAHEVAHVVLDHALATYQSNKQNNRARNILGSVIGGVTSVVAPGLGGRQPLESTIYDLSADLAIQYLDREFIAAAGLKYDRDQERAANRLAQKWLLAHDRSPTALYTALRTLRRAEVRSSSSHGTSFSQSHPGTNAERRQTLTAVIKENGWNPGVLDISLPPPDSTYDTRIAAVFEHEAEMDLAARRFHSARAMLDRALRTPWTTSQTFLFKAIAVRNTTTGPAGASEALTLLDQAEAVADTLEPRIEAERALLKIRQGHREEARRHLARCLRQIDELRASGNLSSTDHDSLHTWAAKMRTRLSE